MEPYTALDSYNQTTSDIFGSRHAGMILGALLLALSAISVLGNAFVLVVHAVEGRWQQKTRFFTGMVCSSLAIGVFFLPLCAVKLMFPESFDFSHAFCVIVDGVQGFCVLNHLLNSCITSVWNYVYVKYPFKAMEWFKPWRINMTITAAWMSGFTYIAIYILTVSRHYYLGAGCLTIFFHIPQWFVFVTIYGIMLPSLILILLVNTGFLVLAHRQMSRRKKHARNTLHVLNQGNHHRHISDDECSINSTLSAVDEEDEHKVVKRRSRSGKRLSIFLFLCILVWIPTIVISNIVALCRECVSTSTLLFASGLSHSISAITPPMFFVLSAEGKKSMAKVFGVVRRRYKAGEMHNPVAL